MFHYESQYAVLIQRVKPALYVVSRNFQGASRQLLLHIAEIFSPDLPLTTISSAFYNGRKLRNVK